MVPNGWLKTDLNPFIDIKHGFAFKSEYFREEGEYVLLTPGSFYEPGGFRDQKSKTKYYVGDIPKGYLLSKGELLVAMTEQAAGLLGSTLFVPSHDRYLHNQRLGLIQIKDKNGICPEFLYLTYNSPYVRKQIAEQSTGTKVKHTSPDKLKSVICLLPPLPEQRKIAQTLSTWDRGIATTEKLIDASKQQKKALMQQLLTGKKRLVDPETGKAFEGDWESKSPISLFKLFSGFAFKSADATDSGTKWLKIANVGIGEIKWDADSFLPRHFLSEHKKFLLTKGDIVVALTRPTLGNKLKVARLTKESDTSLLNQRVAKIVCKNNVSSEFIFQVLRSDQFAHRINIGLLGTDPPNLSVKVLDDFVIAVPPYQEQQKIASVLTAADKDIELLETKLAHFKQEKKALMQQLLTGKRRVSLSS
ncbi:restriction endonuclease subunit S [Vibrio sp. OPT20]|uniref:restriction endonuclease subunit S n=1 Tax=Vibrio sp. OPT20 TaxID=2778642 RepID=UPI00188128B7|nr:restriction endonuclease subunit S [Vibrio sp. OPT20]MBE8564194.1 restriction endonuclease subunit S [Vibrio sp. OPT20]